jgi:hypothetical protein
METVTAREKLIQSNDIKRTVRQGSRVIDLYVTKIVNELY